MRLMEFDKPIEQVNESPIVHANDSPNGKIMRYEMECAQAI